MMQQVSSTEIWQSLQLSDASLFASEENATFWLWAYPSLLGWPRKFEWLFSPVVGNSKHPGDLWGIDEAGNLLLVETKRGRSNDPFQDFIGYETEKRWETTANSDQLLKRWQTLYNSEQAFWQNNKTDLISRSLDEITAKGTVPYSSKRFATRHWSILYTNVIVPYLFEKQAYVQNVNRYLNAQTPLTNRLFFYIGLIFVKDHNLATLSAKGKKHFLELKTLAGDDRVVLISMTAKESLAEKHVLLNCVRQTKA